MHVGVGDADGQFLDMDNDHMRVGGADVILDYQSSAGASGGGGEARMGEFEFRGAIEPAHECRDQRTVGVGETVNGSAVEALLGQFLLHDVEPLVQIHHK